LWNENVSETEDFHEKQKKIKMINKMILNRKQKFLQNIFIIYW